MADVNQFLTDIKNELKPLAEQNAKEFAAEAQQDGEAFLEESKAKLTKWLELLAAGDIEQDEFELLVRSQKSIAAMRALQEANAATIRIEQFRDSFVKAVVKTAVKTLASNKATDQPAS